MYIFTNLSFLLNLWIFAVQRMHLPPIFACDTVALYLNLTCISTYQLLQMCVGQIKSGNEKNIQRNCMKSRSYI